LFVHVKSFRHHKFLSAKGIGTLHISNECLEVYIHHLEYSGTKYPPTGGHSTKYLSDRALFKPLTSEERPRAPRLVTEVQLVTAS
jgi:hypothetical protein